MCALARSVTRFAKQSGNLTCITDELIGTNILDFFHHFLKKRSREVIFNKQFGTRFSRAVAVVERVQQEQFQEWITAHYSLLARVNVWTVRRDKYRVVRLWRFDWICKGDIWSVTGQYYYTWWKRKDKTKQNKKHDGLFKAVKMYLHFYILHSCLKILAVE